MNKLLSIRESKGITQQEFADQSCVDIAIIRKIENNEVDFGTLLLTVVLNLGKPLGVAVEI